MNTIFLQFANKMRIAGEDFLGLGNGFSDTFDLCNKYGDFVWFEQEHAKLSDKSEPWCLQTSPPIKTGRIFASAINIVNLFQLYVWAKNYPGIDFIIGGPIVCSKAFVLKEELPRNMMLTDQTVEEFFGFPDFYFDWKLEPPKAERIAFAYTIDTSCYWGKCTFCGPHSLCRKRVRPKLNFEFRDLDFNGGMHIRLNSPSFPPSKMVFLENLPEKDNICYNVLMRPSRAESERFASFLLQNRRHRFVVGLGIEFPSNRMLSIMNKGITTYEMIEAINLLCETSANVILTGILGFNSLEETDLTDLEFFYSQLPKKYKLILYKLKHVANKDIHATGEPENNIQIGPFYLGYTPKLDVKQIELNRLAEEIILKHASKVVNYYE